MRRAARLTALLIMSVVAHCLQPALLEAGGGDDVSWPAKRGKKHVNEEVMAVFKPVAELGYKAAEALGKALGKAPDEKYIATRVWPPLLAADGTTATFKKKIHDDYDAHVKKEESDYKEDHATWVNIVFKDRSGTMDELYKNLLAGGALSFAPDFDAISGDYLTENPGYGWRDGSTAYLDNYKDLMSKWHAYSEAFIEAGNAQVRESGTLAQSVVTMNSQIFSQVKYRKAQQARNQANLLASQEVMNLRLDIARQVDARTKFAMTLQKTRADRHAAFERSVGTWERQTAQSTRF